ncbi:hypothetical protein Q1695_007698 [Nippostrongylus brasiliensis]|nr:hypothetical protein Q1695_007698 [Nippostrongylus brasiliensis]
MWNIKPLQRALLDRLKQMEGRQGPKRAPANLMVRGRPKKAPANLMGRRRPGKALANLMGRRRPRKALASLKDREHYSALERSTSTRKQ